MMKAAMTVSSSTASTVAVFPAVTFPVQPPDPQRVQISINQQAWDKEKEDVSGHQNVSEINQQPCIQKIVVVVSPPQTSVQYQDFCTNKTPGKYLWILHGQRFKIVLEHDSTVVADFQLKGRVCHTNLTGGLDAHCGGELYFTSESEIWINGGSGRYPPLEYAHLLEVAEGLRTFGFTVHDMGWDTQLQRSKRHIR